MLKSEYDRNSFIGVSLDNKVFLTDWTSKTIITLLEKHDRVLFLIADDLLKYTRTSINKNGMSNYLDFKNVEKYIEKRKEAFINNIDISLLKLNDKDRAKIEIREWKAFEDYQYVDILRNLIIAFQNIQEFREDIYSVASEHKTKIPDVSLSDNILKSSALYIVDETAMAIRVAELENYNYEYYPGIDLAILHNLYKGKYERYGLTVRNLINQEPKRIFTALLHN